MKKRNDEIKWDEISEEKRKNLEILGWNKQLFDTLKETKEYPDTYNKLWDD